MTPLRANNRLKQKSDTLLLLTSSGVRRGMFLLLFFVFGIAMIVGFDPTKDFSGSRLGGTIIYLLVLFALIGVAAWSRTLVFDTAEGHIQTVYRLFGMVVKSEEALAIHDLQWVLLQNVQLLNQGTLPLKRGGTLSHLFEVRSRLFRLFLATSEGRFKIDEGNYQDELEREGTYISQFLSIPYKTEEI